MYVRHESEQIQKVPRSLQHLKLASWFQVGEVWFSGRHSENRTCLFRFRPSLGAAQGCSVSSEQRGEWLPGPAARSPVCRAMAGAEPGTGQFSPDPIWEAWLLQR